MSYREFRNAVQASGFTLAQLRCDVPPTDALLAFMDEVGERYEQHLMRLQEQVSRIPGYCWICGGRCTRNCGY